MPPAGGGADARTDRRPCVRARLHMSPAGRAVDADLAAVEAADGHIAVAARSARLCTPARSARIPPARRPRPSTAGRTRRSRGSASLPLSQRKSARPRRRAPRLVPSATLAARPERARSPRPPTTRHCSPPRGQSRTASAWSCQHVRRSPVVVAEADDALLSPPDARSALAAPWERARAQPDARVRLEPAPRASSARS